MALIERTVKSEALGRSNNVRLFVPDSGNSLFPVIYFHHGLGSNGSTPWEKTGLPVIAEDYRMIIVTSDAEDSWFVNDITTGCMWENYFSTELPDYIEREFPAAPGRKARGQCGFSMGGYGAMMLTLLNPDRFSAVSTHSGSFVFGHEYRKDRPERAVYMKAVAPPGGRYDLFRHVSEYPWTKDNLPAIRMDIGRDDYLIEQDRRFHQCLNENGIDHYYAENSGTHSWGYVDEHLKDSLDFFAEKLSC